jgi:Txe/YoeB family toxin of Txe-Axe toxin-antitoxin module
LSATKRRIRVEADLAFRDWLNASKEDEINSRIRHVVDLLKSNAFLGEQIPRRLWPRKSPLYREINNLYRIRVTDQARMTYTVIARGQDEMVVRILEFFGTHSEYDRRFGYS